MGTAARIERVLPRQQYNTAACAQRHVTRIGGQISARGTEVAIGHEGEITVGAGEAAAAKALLTQVRQHRQ